MECPKHYKSQNQKGRGFYPKQNFKVQKRSQIVFGWKPTGCLEINNNKNMALNSLYDVPKAVLREIFNSLTIHIVNRKSIYNEYSS